MENLHRLKTEALVDMLSTHTDAYIRMQTMGVTEEAYARCRLRLWAIQKEIDLRKKKEANTASTRPPDEETLIG